MLLINSKNWIIFKGCVKFDKFSSITKMRSIKERSAVLYKILQVLHEDESKTCGGIYKLNNVFSLS